MNPIHSNFPPSSSTLPEGTRPPAEKADKSLCHPEDHIELGTSPEHQSTPDNTRKLRLTILHTNDLHGRLTPFHNKFEYQFDPLDIPRENPEPSGDVEAEAARGGLAHIAHIVKKERAENPEGTLLLDAGDISTGSFVSDFFKTEPMVAAMNTMKYDALAVGNHEFDKRIESLRELVGKADFPFLSANLIDKEGGIDPLPIKPYFITECNGIKIGILGLLTPETLQQINKEDRKEIDILDPLESAEKQIVRMREEGAELVIVLSHLGVHADRTLAHKVTGIDVIVGGHTHTELSPHEKIGNTYIVQAGALGTKLGKLELDITRNNNKLTIDSARSELIPINADLPRDEEVNSIIATYTDQLSSFLGKTVGTAGIDLKAESYQTSWKESNLADFVTDSLRTHGKTDLCLVPTSTFRGNIPAGEVKVSDIYTVFPWDDGISKIEVTGKAVKNILEAGVMGRALGVTPSGLTFTCDLTRPRGDRITQVTLSDGTPLDPDKIYSMTARNYTLDSGAFPEYHDYFTRTHLKESPQEVLINRFESGIPVAQEIDGRINIIGLKQK